MTGRGLLVLLVALLAACGTTDWKVQESLVPVVQYGRVEVPPPPVYTLPGSWTKERVRGDPRGYVRDLLADLNTAKADAADLRHRLELVNVASEKAEVILKDMVAATRPPPAPALAPDE